MVDTARDVVDVPLSRAQNFSRARSASGNFFLLSEAKTRSRRIDFEKSLENWRNWLVSSRAARNFRQVRAVWPSNFAKKVSPAVCRKRDSNLSPPNKTWTSLSFADFHYNRPEISRFTPPVLSMRIVLSCFYLLIFYFENFSTCLTFSVCRKRHS